MDIRCTDKELFVFNKIAHAAADLNVEAWIIGGFVRDKLIGRNTKDADIVCVGDGIELAHRVADRFNPRPPVAFFKTYGTAQIKLKGFYRKEEAIPAEDHHAKEHTHGPEATAAEPPSLEVKDETVFEIEFVGARKESYRYHSRNP